MINKSEKSEEKQKRRNTFNEKLILAKKNKNN